ncbi:MAG: hypothetical protein CO186_12715 [Zetaproteobacteria bacterium CG_4_9_14_3_um_filter_49_83]|nr:MAG: hypothetical protein COW62_00535 [Zetaproteobacteria bacterium CG17_big_fil_post_rev_8_21_14_2_50_50_13]PIV31386.1 MAG: hypothetical protein COS35_01610 [Zetaproteobacteria bacterium CG02_land_8_20_14_3_00_50_9]PIY56590.1 MAG: hypothetical protein COZ00_03355 [Zetaproteobacteria bacterium CG_4_10_14_0_8_um_filter_49_80]PJA33822.1 MAG: hypothetical protein CO186_12715 [Zetaproteobacteria bacterium CG_4_9_14_3_um_filter_49_83]
MKKTMLLLTAVMIGLSSQAALASDIDVEKVFKKKCAMCHKADAKKVGPALKDMNVDAEVLKLTITEGRKMMPAFAKKLSGEEIEALVAYIQSNQPLH